MVLKFYTGHQLPRFSDSITANPRWRPVTICYYFHCQLWLSAASRSPCCDYKKASKLT